jgi:hypothetical protein
MAEATAEKVGIVLVGAVLEAAVLEGMAATVELAEHQEMVMELVVLQERAAVVLVTDILLLIQKQVAVVRAAGQVY